MPSEYNSDDSVNKAVGDTAPELHGKSFAGTPVNITNDGKAKIIMFFAHWCPHCQREVPKLSPWLAANMKNYPNLEFYAIATGSDSAKPNFPPSTWLKKNNWPTPVMADSKNYDAADAFGLGAYPYIVGINSKGKITDRESGELSTDQFQAMINGAKGTQGI